MRTNLILAFVLMALASFAYWFEFQKKGEIKRAEEARTRLFAVDNKQELESVRIVDQARGINLEMRCTKDCVLSSPVAAWEIVSPIQFKADNGNVGTFITSLASANIQESIQLEGELEAELKKFGLEKGTRENNMATVKFKSEAEPYTVYLGDNAAVGENLYAYVTGPGLKSDVVRIVPGHLRNSLQRDLTYWRDKRLFQFAASEVEALKLKNSSGTVRLVREQGNWYLMPGKRLADNEAVDTFVTGLVFMNAKDYVSDNKKKDRSKFKLPSKPKYEVEVTAGKSAPIELSIYDVLKDGQPKIYGTLKHRDFIVELDRTGTEKFAKKDNAFRFRNLVTSAEKQEVAKVELKLGKERFEFEKSGDEWKLATGKIENFDPASVGKALTKVGAARIAEFLGKRGVPAGNHELSAWVLKKADGKVLRSFQIHGTNEKGNYYAKLHTGELTKLERGSGSAVPSKVTDFQKVPSTAQK